MNARLIEVGTLSTPRWVWPLRQRVTKSYLPVGFLLIASGVVLIINLYKIKKREFYFSEK